MKMPQNIIAKYNLQVTDHQIGKSFINGLKVYKSTRPDIQNLLFAECDINGEDRNYISILNQNDMKSIQVTPEFMGDIAFEAMIKEAL